MAPSSWLTFMYYRVKDAYIKIVSEWYELKHIKSLCLCMKSKGRLLWQQTSEHFLRCSASVVSHEFEQKIITSL